MGKLHKALEEKHILLLGLGSAVGVGLFLGSAGAIRQAGPAILVAYFFAGLIAYSVLRALGEMTVYEPATGSFAYYAHKFVSPLAGYLIGWSYWIYWVFVGLAEVTAVGVYMGLWFPDTPQWIWALGSLLMMGAVNFMPVKHFGEFEYWFSLIKIVVLALLVAFGFGFVFFGIGNDFQAVGISNLWAHGGFAPMGVSGILMASNLALFAYIGSESLGLSASEAHDPAKTIPRVINTIVRRMIALYLGALFIILCIFPWNQISLNGSPFVAMFDSIGLRQGAGIINFVVITAALSSCNAGIFSAGRILLGLAETKQAPKIFGYVSKNGVPAVAVAITVILPIFGLVINYYLPEEAFTRITSAVTFTGLFVWIGILVTHIFFRRKIGPAKVKKLVFPIGFHPWSIWLGLLGMGVVIASMAFSEMTRLGFYVLPPSLVILTILFYALGLNKKK